MKKRLSPSWLVAHIHEHNLLSEFLKTCICLLGVGLQMLHLSSSRQMQHGSSIDAVKALSTELNSVQPMTLSAFFLSPCLPPKPAGPMQEHISHTNLQMSHLCS